MRGLPQAAIGAPGRRRHPGAPARLAVDHRAVPSFPHQDPTPRPGRQGYRDWNLHTRTPPPPCS